MAKPPISDKDYTVRLERVGVGSNYLGYEMAVEKSVMRLFIRTLATLVGRLVRPEEQPTFILQLALFLLQHVKYDQSEYKKWKAKIAKDPEGIMDLWVIADEPQTEEETLAVQDARDTAADNDGDDAVAP